ncbi:MAG: Hsp33 family molecular chaperone HslO [Planctomycetota bacterium]
MTRQTTQKPGGCVIQRTLDHEKNVLFAHGQFEPIFLAYIDHSRRWEEPPEPLIETMMRQGLAAAALHLSCRPIDESVGWTISIQEPPLNLFLTGDAGTERVAGRSFDHGVEPADHNRLYVQSSRHHAPPSKSMLDVAGLDILGVFEQYYRQSEQFPARFFDYENGYYVMVLGLPGVDPAWLDSLERDTAFAALRQSERPLDQRMFYFSCGCDPKRMREVVDSIYKDNPEDLFQGESRVEIQCPRCARRWELHRDAF